jgi:hypothetical protein
MPQQEYKLQIKHHGLFPNMQWTEMLDFANNAEDLADHGL